MIRINGVCDSRFRGVRETFRELIGSGLETGAALSVLLEGRPVVDLWAGTSGVGSQEWNADTIVHAYSVSKPFAACSLLLLVDRGQIDLDAPVCQYWPQFAAHGKETATVRHLLSHQVGVVQWSRPQALGSLLEWPSAVRLCEAETPAWTPGCAHGEHLVSYGHLVGELVRRVDGRSIGRFLRDEICYPLGLDFSIGLTEEELTRCAAVTGMDDKWRAALFNERTETFANALNNPPGLLDASVINGRAYRTAEVPSINGHGTARAVAGLYSNLLSSLIADGFLSSALASEAVRQQCGGPDLVLGRDVSWGLGFQLSAGTFRMGGLGGSVGLADINRGYAFAYLTRLMADGSRAQLLQDALNACLA